MGGLSGHMMHPHDNLDLTIGGFKELCNMSLRGQLCFTEKIDGFNIHVLKHEGKMRFARNAGDLANNGFGFEDIDNRFSNDRVRNIYKRAWEWLSTRLDLSYLPEFSVVHVTLNCEVIIEGRTNIMPYMYDRVIVHNAHGWRVRIKDDGTRKFVPHTVQAAVFRRPTTLILDRPVYNRPDYVDTTFIDRACKKIFGTYDMSEHQTLRDYYRMRFVQIMSIKFPEYLEIPELIRALFNRFFKDGEQINLREIRRMTTSDINPILDKANDIVYATKYDLDQLILKIGTIILDNTTGVNALTTQIAAGILTQDIIEAPVRDERFCQRWAACNNKVLGIEGVVCEYNHNLYKWTGPFAPINQLLGRNRK